MEEVRASEVRATLEDLMYVSILEKFLLLGVDMLPRMEGTQFLVVNILFTAFPSNFSYLCNCTHQSRYYLQALWRWALWT